MAGEDNSNSQASSQAAPAANSPASAAAPASVAEPGLIDVHVKQPVEKADPPKLELPFPTIAGAINAEYVNYNYKDSYDEPITWGQSVRRFLVSHIGTLFGGAAGYFGAGLDGIKHGLLNIIPGIAGATAAYSDSISNSLGNFTEGKEEYQYMPESDKASLNRRMGFSIAANGVSTLYTASKIANNPDDRNGIIKGSFILYSGGYIANPLAKAVVGILPSLEKAADSLVDGAGDTLGDMLEDIFEGAENEVASSNKLRK